MGETSQMEDVVKNYIFHDPEYPLLDEDGWPQRDIPPNFPAGVQKRGFNLGYSLPGTQKWHFKLNERVPVAFPETARGTRTASGKCHSIQRVIDYYPHITEYDNTCQEAADSIAD